MDAATIERISKPFSPRRIPARTPAALAPDQVVACGHGERILVVDDEPAAALHRRLRKQA